MALATPPFSCRTLMHQIKYELQAKDVLPNINRTQDTETAEKNAVFVRGNLDLWPWHSNSSERGTKHVSLWIWRKSVQRFLGYFIHKQKSQKQNRTVYRLTAFRSSMRAVEQHKLECGPMPNVMVALPNIGGALCSTPQSLADAHY